jgi:hypothetical protein
MSDFEVISDIENAAEAAMNILIPERSKSAYQSTYDKFEIWCKQKKVVTITEKVVLKIETIYLIKWQYRIQYFVQLSLFLTIVNVTVNLKF